MGGKTPSSLMWLIGKQTRLAGQMQRRSEELQRLKARAEEVEAEIAALAVKRSQIESVMKLHEVQVDPCDLRAIRPHERKSILGHGGITRVIFATLRDAENNTAATTELVAAVIRHMTSEPDPKDIRRIKERVRIRLSIMTSEGKLTPIRGRNYSTPSSWRLATVPSETQPGFPTVDHGGADV